MYALLRSFFFRFPPEAVHHFSMNALRLFCRIGGTGLLRSLFRPGNTATVNLLGLPFPNKIGLAAGFDKNALYLRELEALGFGHVEIGTVTPRPQPGNDRPRLFRLPKDRALINRMGFNNEGVDRAAERLKAWRGAGSAAAKRLIVGGNIGKNKDTPNEEAWKDYEICFQALYPWVDYFVVNVSSPNTPGLRALQEKDSLRKILTHLQDLRSQRQQKDGRKPLLLKIAPDLTNEQLDDVISLALEIGLDGLVATNTTISREGLKTDPEKVKAMGAGGLSGAPVRERSTAVLRYIHKATAGRIPVIASGGIFTAEDAREKLEAGASLVQVWTGFIYEGPGIVRKICKGLREE